MTLEPWLGLVLIYFAGHAFVLGFALGTYYVKSVANPEPQRWRPEWLENSIAAYQQSHRRPLSAEDVAAVDWQETEH